ncbi:MAG: FG-GAP repeat domain-containing protein, partial [Planctomycetota bacterium]
FTALRGEDLQPIYSLDRRTVGMDLWDLDPVGDFNGDGRADFLATGYVNNSGGTWIRGISRILSGSDGSELFQALGAEFEEFGRKATGLGDVDGDGIPDFAVLSLLLNQSWASAPKVQVFSGADGAELDSIQSPVFRWFTALVGGVSDLDGDGRAEILLAVSEDQVGGGTPGFLPGGEVYLAGYKD